MLNVTGKPAFREAMKCAKDYPPEVNDLEEAGLETLPSKRIKPPEAADFQNSLLYSESTA